MGSPVRGSAGGARTESSAAAHGSRLLADPAMRVRVVGRRSFSALKAVGGSFAALTRRLGTTRPACSITWAILRSPSRGTIGVGRDARRAQAWPRSDRPPGRRPLDARYCRAVPAGRNPSARGGGSVDGMRRRKGGTTLGRIQRIVARVPRGRVITYGEAAAVAGIPGAARVVVWALHRAEGLPWHRVVAAGGRIALPGAAGAEQRLRLEMEGVGFRRGRVRMDLYAWRPVGPPAPRGRGRGAGRKGRPLRDRTTPTPSPRRRSTTDPGSPSAKPRRPVATCGAGARGVGPSSTGPREGDPGWGKRRPGTSDGSAGTARESPARSRPPR